MKTITAEEFDAAVPEVATEITMEHSESPQGVILFSMAGIAFATALRKKLFGKEDEE